MAAIDGFLSARDFLLRHRDDRATAMRDFRWPALENFNWALDYFDHIAVGNERPALHIVSEDGGEFVASFATMSRRSHQVASFLRSQGIGRGDPILLMLGNVPALWEVMLAAIKLGAILIPSTTLLTRDDLLDRLARGRVALVVAATEETAKFADLPGSFGRIVVGEDVAGWTSYGAADDASPDFRPDGPTPASQPLLLYFTSGTTAKAKLVMHTHQSYPIGHLSTLYWLGLQPGDIHLNISSPGWAKHAWSCFFAPWIAEATVFVYAFKRFNAKAVLDVVSRHGITSLCAPPTVWRLLVQEDLRRWPMTLRNLVGAGEPLNPEVIDTVKSAWGITIRDGYGQTETTAQIGNSPGMAVKPGSMGQALPGFRVALLALDGREADEGEVCLSLDPRPIGLMPGYADDAERTAEAMAGGYYRTGDVARRDPDGYLTFIGRSDDVFKASDYRISPFELESALIEHDAVAEAAVVPSPDPLRLAAPKAFIALTAGHAPTRDTALAIFAHVRRHLAPFKRVRRIEFAELPKTISGKIRRVELRKLEAERRGAKAYDPGRRFAQEYWEEDFVELRSGTGAEGG
jgi:acetyl-CoA synthetase